MLVAVHGQADQWRLKQGDAHREVVDDFGGDHLLALRDRVGELYDRWRAASREHDRLVSAARERAREIDSLTASLEEIEAVDPQPGEDVDLRAEDERLAHADTLRLAAATALTELSGDEYAGEPAPNVRDLLGAARSALAQASAHDDALRGLDERLHELGTLVTDVAADLTAYLDDVELDPERLAFVQDRRSALGTLTRKYGETVDDVLAWSRAAAVRLDELVTADDRLEALGAELKTLEEGLVATSVELSQARESAGDEFGSRVSDELAHLSMGKAVISVAVRHRIDPGGVELPSGERVRLSRNGIDDVEILLAANPGATARSVAKAASGGELSRVMLALEVVGSRHHADGAPSGPPTFVFDEVDAGVGGRAALDVGARLAALAEQSQVIVVTHLAQVAAFADQHLVVHKSDDGRVTSSSVAVVEGEERLRELSRMMGGDPDSEAGLAHAGDLLEQTAGARQRAPGAGQASGGRATRQARQPAARAAGRASAAS
jgi:DNA repair protein RecN (Recombination protein N)